MGANATVTPNPSLSISMSRSHNKDFNFDANEYLLSRPQDFWVYLFSISERSYEIYRPPIIRHMLLVGKAPKAKYALCARFPHPLNVPDASVDSSELGIKQMDARRLCQDICNPDNLGFDQNSVTGVPTSIGNNLNAKGVFWVTEKECTFDPEDTKRNKPIPPQKYLDDAQKRMEVHYRTLVEKANTVHSSKPSDLAELLTPEHLSAAEYLEENFGMQFAWHARMARLEQCDLCGEKTKAGVAFHRMEDGGICVRDWVRAVKAGARSRADAYDATGDEQFAPRVPKAPTSAPAAPVVIPTEKQK
jgi:hypothetical protein